MRITNLAQIRSKVLVQPKPLPPGPQGTGPADQVVLSAQALAALKPAAVPTESELQARADKVVSDSLTKVPEREGRSRHHTNALVQSQKPGGGGRRRVQAHYDGSPVVVIAFEGTGAFDDRRPALMQRLGRSLQDEGVDTSHSSFRPAQLLDKALEKKRGRGAHWSGLSSGPLQEIVKDKELNQGVQWLSFPSEEAEVLSDPEAYKDFSIRRFVGDVRRSSSGTSRGIESALRRVKEIAAEAKRQGKNPKFVLLSHSSGGRSSVKFAEKLGRLKNPASGDNFDIALSVSIDPVREAHEAVFEAGKEVLGHKAKQGFNALKSLVGLEKSTVDDPRVESRSQPESLYQPKNVDKWLNFYQRTDTEGLKMPIKFGIHGSPIARAQNTEIHDTKADGHGAIAYHPTVLNSVLSELRDLVRSK